MKLSDIIILSANSALKLQIPSGAMPPGHNGPYNHKSTPVRNTAHWAIVFLKAYDITKDSKFRDAAVKCCDYLISKEARPHGYSFLSINDPVRETNGLIGDAWVIEALAVASRALNDDKYGNAAREVFLMHPFTPEYGVWQVLYTDGRVAEIYDVYDSVNDLTIKVSETFNHMLWFAVSGLVLSLEQDDAIDSQLNIFFDKLPYFFEIYQEGLISHHPYVKGKMIQDDLQERHREAAYHSFNLYAYALIKQIKPDLKLFNTTAFKKALQFLTTSKYFDELLNTKYEKDERWTPSRLKELGHNRYGFAYNATGFEMAFVFWVFQDSFKNEPDFDLSLEMSFWVSEQIRRCFNFKTGLMTLNTEDDMTLAARIYEATRLPDLELVDIKINN